eukprot:NODE_6064_length_345_cov_768.250000_g4916_i0.p1 GENE.NODE_6064_length_345_cov_768.250000_g4916_i0~~NODE_6064_length_345_cov_768.250000_g4916_i0.p1  ORF type:complete len:62 (+),score=33.06 NODE_6064_length_345_cov_768.250000_g4916_i0:32-187(+)
MGVASRAADSNKAELVATIAAHEREKASLQKDYEKEISGLKEEIQMLKARN